MLNDFVYLRLRGKKTLGLPPHPKTSPVPSNKASNAKANFTAGFVGNCLDSQW